MPCEVNQGFEANFEVDLSAHRAVPAPDWLSSCRELADHAWAPRANVSLKLLITRRANNASDLADLMLLSMGLQHQSCTLAAGTM